MAVYTALGYKEGQLTQVGSADDFKIQGNLVVDGTTTTINTAEIAVEDKNMILGVPGGLKSVGVDETVVSWTGANSDATIVITSDAHGFSDGNKVFVTSSGVGYGASSDQQIPSGVYQVNNKETDTFEIELASNLTSIVNAGHNARARHSASVVTDVTEDGGGISVLKPAGVEELKWVQSTAKWTATKFEATAGFTGALVGNVTGDATGSSGSCTGNAATATALAAARTIGGTSFDGTGNIAVALAATATILANARTLGGVSFDGSANINLPGVNAAGNQSTSGVAATATILATTRAIGGVNFNGSDAITPQQIDIAADAANASMSVLFAAGTSGAQRPGTDPGLVYNPSTNVLSANLTGDVTGNATGSSGSCTGLAATATALASSRTLGGVAFNGTANINLPGVNAGGNQNTSGTAAVATEFTCSDNEDENLNCLMVFVDGATGSQGAETDGDLHYNPSTGTLTATTFSGSIATANISTTATLTDETDNDTTCFVVIADTATGNIGLQTDAARLTYNASNGSLGSTTFVGALTGNASGSSASCTGNAATATILANARTLGGVSFDGSANINLPGVNASGNQNTSGLAATATLLATTRTIGGVSFDGSANITPQQIDIAADSADASMSVLFAAGVSGNQRPGTDPGLVYNPSTNLLTAGSVQIAAFNGLVASLTIATAGSSHAIGSIMTPSADDVLDRGDSGTFKIPVGVLTELGPTGGNAAKLVALPGQIVDMAVTNVNNGDIGKEVYLNGNTGVANVTAPTSGHVISVGVITNDSVSNSRCKVMFMPRYIMAL